MAERPLFTCVFNEDSSLEYEPQEVPYVSNLKKLNICLHTMTSTGGMEVVTHCSGFCGHDIISALINSCVMIVSGQSLAFDWMSDHTHTHE